MSKKHGLIQKIKAWYNKNWKIWRFKLSADNNIFFIGFYKYLYQPKAGSLAAFLNEYSRFVGDKKNKGIHCACAAIGYEDGNQRMYKIRFSKMRWATGLASFSKEKVEQAFDNGIVAHNCRVHGIEIPIDRNEWITEEEVEVISPTSLIKRYDIKKINLLQIDAEGFDFEVIKIFDIASTNPQAIIFENVGLSSEENNCCLELLKNNNYAIRKFGSNTLAFKKPVGIFEKYFLR